MRFQPLSDEQKKDLELWHRDEDDGRIRDRIKAVLLKSEGWKNKAIAQALRIHGEAVRQCLKDWETDEKLKPEKGGSYSTLDDVQTRSLDTHLSDTTSTPVMDICAYVEATLGVRYTVSGMTKWIKEYKFSYKHPKKVPAKADLTKQEEFIEKYLELDSGTPEDEPILFMDSSHPAMVTKIVYGWIKKGVDKPIAQTASRARVNIIGAIALTTMNVVSCRPEYVNAETTVAFFDHLKTAYPDAALDNIKLHDLPPYTQNVNSIARL